MIITQRRVQNAIIDNQAARIEAIVTQRQQLRAATSQGGMPDMSQANGYYDESGAWKHYLRLDIDDFNDGFGCAP